MQLTSPPVCYCVRHLCAGPVRRLCASLCSIRVLAYVQQQELLCMQRWRMCLC